MATFSTLRKRSFASWPSSKSTKSSRKCTHALVSASPKRRLLWRNSASLNLIYCPSPRPTAKLPCPVRKQRKRSGMVFSLRSTTILHFWSIKPCAQVSSSRVTKNSPRVSRRISSWKSKNASKLRLNRSLSTFTSTCSPISTLRTSTSSDSRTSWPNLQVKYPMKRLTDWPTGSKTVFRTWSRCKSQERLLSNGSLKTLRESRPSSWLSQTVCNVA